jgi:protein-S-isoprenylcysteine O-methyltransferase Ste14
MKLVSILCSVTTGPRRRRALLTPIALVIALGLIFLAVLAGLATDKALGLPSLLPGAPGIITGIILLVPGLLLHIWCLSLFWRAKGSGVPVSPPPRVVETGPYAWTRNPMLIAACAWLSGIGFLLHSTSLVLVWTPLFLIMNVIELKLVEEPELERRLGEEYTDYKQRVPMLFPRVPGTRGKENKDKP